MVYGVALGQEEMVYYLGEMYDGAKWDLSQREKELLAGEACRRAYRFGDRMEIHRAEDIVRRLKDVQAPFCCPHSRMLISYFGNA